MFLADGEKNAEATSPIVFLINLYGLQKNCLKPDRHTKNLGNSVLKEISAVLEAQSTDLSTCPAFSTTEIMSLKWAPLSTAIFERSFSINRNFFTIRWASFTDDALKRHLFVQINKSLLLLNFSLNLKLTFQYRYKWQCKYCR